MELSLKSNHSQVDFCFLRFPHLLGTHNQCWCLVPRQRGFCMGSLFSKKKHEAPEVATSHHVDPAAAGPTPEPPVDTGKALSKRRNAVSAELLRVAELLPRNASRRCATSMVAAMACMATQQAGDGAAAVPSDVALGVLAVLVDHAGGCGWYFAPSMYLNEGGTSTAFFHRDGNIAVTIPHGCNGWFNATSATRGSRSVMSSPSKFVSTPVSDHAKKLLALCREALARGEMVEVSPDELSLGQQTEVAFLWSSTGQEVRHVGSEGPCVQVKISGELDGTKPLWLMPEGAWRPTVAKIDSDEPLAAEMLGFQLWAKDEGKKKT